MEKLLNLEYIDFHDDQRFLRLAFRLYCGNSYDTDHSAPPDANGING